MNILSDDVKLLKDRELLQKIIKSDRGIKNIKDVKRFITGGSALSGKHFSPDSLEKICALKEFFTRCLYEKVDQKKAVGSMRDLINYLSFSMKNLPFEVMKVVFLDVRQCIIGTKQINSGTVDHVVLYSREVIRESLKRNAYSIILCHNHPSGVSSPSEADRKLTRDIQDQLLAAGITLFDHIILARAGHYSFFDNGFIQRRKPEKKSWIIPKIKESPCSDDKKGFCQLRVDEGTLADEIYEGKFYSDKGFYRDKNGNLFEKIVEVSKPSLESWRKE